MGYVTLVGKSEFRILPIPPMGPCTNPWGRSGYSFKSCEPISVSSFLQNSMLGWPEIEQIGVALLM